MCGPETHKHTSPSTVTDHCKPETSHSLATALYNVRMMSLQFDYVTTKLD